MLGHVSIRVLDLEASVQFYLKALSPFGLKPMTFPEVVGIGPAEPSKSSPIPWLWLRKHIPGPQNNDAEKPTPVHISFYASERIQVDEFHRRGLQAGGKDNGPPGLRPFMEGYYAAYILDLDGNNIEVVYFG